MGQKTRKVPAAILCAEMAAPARAAASVRQLLICAASWVGEARIIGELRACDISDMARRILSVRVGDEGISPEDIFSVPEWDAATAMLSGMTDEQILRGEGLDGAPSPAIAMATGMAAIAWSGKDPDICILGNLRVEDLGAAMRLILRDGPVGLQSRMETARLMDADDLGL